MKKTGSFFYVQFKKNINWKNKTNLVYFTKYIEEGNKLKMKSLIILFLTFILVNSLPKNYKREIPHTFNTSEENGNER
jgi:hypothetical protein